MNSDEVIRLRVEAAKEAQRRSRISFLISIVVSLAIIIVCWNSYLSWYRAMAIELVSRDEVASQWRDNPVLEHHQKALLTEWISSRTISVPLLGIRTGIADASVLGGLSLLVISLWFFYSMRRENHLIGELLQDTKRANSATREYIFHGVASYLVFTSLSEIDQPFTNLEGRVPTKKSVTVARRAMRLLVYLPVIAIGMVMLMDLLSLFVLPSPFRETPSEPLWKILSVNEWAQAALMLFLAFGFLIVSWVFSYHASFYEKSTARILNQYANLPKQEGEK